MPSPSTHVSTMKSKLQVFVSSTYLDLKDDRQAAVEAILKAGHIPAGMELFTAGDKSQWEVIQHWILDSDVYMLILGGRYGTIDKDSGLSYTELEYDFAVKSGKPLFAVVIKDDALEARNRTLGSSVLEKDNPAKYKKFKKKVLSKMSSFFSDHKDIKLAVHESLPKLEDKNKLKGWVRHADLPDTTGLIDQFITLNAENKQLQEKICQQAEIIKKSKSKAEENDNEFLELIAVLQKITVKPPKLVSAKSVLDSKDCSLLDIAYGVKDVLMFGVTNKSTISEYEKFICLTVCPKLQTYELVHSEKVPGVQWRRFSITKKGQQFFAFYEKILYKCQANDLTINGK